ncbi:MAG: hypothetical protein U1F15_15705 [Burkholderiales bacterium]
MSIADLEFVLLLLTHSKANGVPASLTYEFVARANRFLTRENQRAADAGASAAVAGGSEQLSQSTDSQHDNSINALISWGKACRPAPTAKKTFRRFSSWLP